MIRLMAEVVVAKVTFMFKFRRRCASWRAGFVWLWIWYDSMRKWWRSDDIRVEEVVFKIMFFERLC